MVDLRKLKSSNQNDSRKVLAKTLQKEEDELKGEIRDRNKTSSSNSIERGQSSVFDFLLTEKYHTDFLELLKLNQTLADPSNKTSKTTLLSQKKFLEMVKSMRVTDNDLSNATQSAFYKWLSRNGLGTRDQITKYYKSRSKEIANHIKRRVIIEELISDLADRPELIKELFSQEEFQKQMKILIKRELKNEK